jgi:hypothetical protein
MTDTQLEFCRDVAKAMKVYREYHPDYELTEEQDADQQALADEFTADQELAQAADDSAHADRIETDAKYTYYRKMNYLLREISGAAIPEPIGTGNPDADYKRAMNVVDK